MLVPRLADDVVWGPTLCRNVAIVSDFSKESDGAAVGLSWLASIHTNEIAPVLSATARPLLRRMHGVFNEMLFSECLQPIWLSKSVGPSGYTFYTLHCDCFASAPAPQRRSAAPVS